MCDCPETLRHKGRLCSECEKRSFTPRSVELRNKINSLRDKIRRYQHRLEGYKEELEELEEPETKSNNSQLVMPNYIDGYYKLVDNDIVVKRINGNNIDIGAIGYLHESKIIPLTEDLTKYCEEKHIQILSS